MTNAQQKQIEALKAWASARYDDGYGYQVFIECYGDSDWLELIADAGGTLREARKLAQDIADVNNEQFAGAQGEY